MPLLPSGRELVSSFPRPSDTPSPAAAKSPQSSGASSAAALALPLPRSFAWRSWTICCWQRRGREGPPRSASGAPVYQSSSSPPVFLILSGCWAAAEPAQEDVAIRHQAPARRRGRRQRSFRSLSSRPVHRPASAVFRGPWTAAHRPRQRLAGFEEGCRGSPARHPVVVRRSSPRRSRIHRCWRRRWR